MFIYRLLRPPIGLIARTVWRASLVDEHHVPAAGPGILAVAHASTAETWMLPALLHRPLFNMAKHTLFTKPGPIGRFIAWFFRSGCVIPVNRNGGAASAGALVEAEQVLHDGHLIGVYPEGTRSPDGRLFKGKTGAVRLALATGAPVIPVVAHGAFAARRGSSVFPRFSPRVRIQFGEPIHVAEELRALRATAAGAAHPGAPATLAELRTLTNAMMGAIASLSGQEMVDEYAADFRRRMASDTSVDPASRKKRPTI